MTPIVIAVLSIAALVGAGIILKGLAGVRKERRQHLRAVRTEARQAFASMMGYLAKSDGVVSEEELVVADVFFEESLVFEGENKEGLREAFNRGKAATSMQGDWLRSVRREIAHLEHFDHFDGVMFALASIGTIDESRQEKNVGRRRFGNRAQWTVFWEMTHSLFLIAPHATTEMIAWVERTPSWSGPRPPSITTRGGQE